jgi:hypothetical protein
MYKPTEAMAAEAKRALKWKEEGKATGAGTRVGWTRANQLANRENVSLDTVKRIYSYLSRHAVDAQGKGWSPGQEGYPSNGRIMYAAWGGKPGLSWSRQILESEKRKQMKKSTWGGAFSPVGPSAKMDINVDEFLIEEEPDAPLDEVEVGIESTAAIEGETVDTTPEGGMHEPQEQVEPEMQDTNEMNAAEDRGGIADPML